MRVIEGLLVVSKLRVALVLSRQYGFIGERLLEGAQKTLIRHGVRHQNIQVLRVPGLWDIPLAIQEILLQGKTDGVISLGSTGVKEYVCSEQCLLEVSRELVRLSLEHRTPVSKGFLYADSLKGASLQEDAENKGKDAALSIIEMVNLLDQLRDI